MSNKSFQEELIVALQTCPERIAIESGSRHICYQMLLTNARLIAMAIRPKLVTNDSKLVGILTGDRIEFICGITGVSLAGGVFVPLDNNLPAQRLQQMISAVGLSIVITSYGELENEELKTYLSQAGITVLYLEELYNNNPDEHPAVQTSPESPLYIYFTSGSTGIPKAIVGKNKSLLHFMQWEIDAFQIGTGERFSQLITPGFDAFLRDVFVPLFTGGTICIPGDPKAIFQEDILVNWVDEQRIQYIHCVPSVFRLLNRDGNRRKPFDSLKYIFMSGERIRPAELENWFNQYDERIQLVNFYGTTETTLISSYYCIRSEDVRKENIPIGKPIWDAALRVLDSDLKPVGPLQTGELYIGSAYSSLGYFNDPGLNKERFGSNLQHIQPGFVFFKTGDKAKRLENGDIELAGRIDRQIKLRGMRVEPEEIEKLLIKQLEVKDAVIELIDVNDQPTLCAFLVLANSIDSRTVKETIDHELRSALPEYMVPSLYIELDELPRKLNGKINYTELKNYVPQETTGKRAPVTEAEQQLFDLWTAIIRTDKISTSDTFFEVGGNSFHLISLVAKVHSYFKVRLSIQEIFQHNTIEKLALFIASRTDKKETVIPVIPDQENYPLTAGQFQIFQQQQLNAGSTAYNLPQFFVLEGKLDVRKMQQAFQQLTKIHSMLSTGFEIKNDEPVQFVRDNVTLHVDYQEVPSWSTKEEQRYIQNFVKPFDLAKPPLLRAEILKRDRNCYLLLIDVHHIIVDGVSQKLLNRDLLRLYAGREVQPAMLQYKDFAVWQSKERAEGGFEKQKKYWLSKLDAPPQLIPLPTDYSTYNPLNTEGAVLDFVLSEKQATSIKKIVQDKQVTLFAFFLSVYYILLSKLSGQRDVVVGTAASGRRLQPLEKIVGMFINTLALRCRVNPHTPFDEFLKQVQQDSIEALENQDLPFEDVVRQLKLPGSRRNPLFNVMLVFQNMDIAQEDTAEFSVEAYPFAQQTSKFDLTLFVREINNIIFFKLEYSTQLFYEEQVARFMKYFSEIISALLEEPSIRIGAIALSHDLEEAVDGDAKIEFNF